jgi:hypothetical protein
MSSSTANSFEIPSQTVISPSLNPSIQKNIDDWINNKTRDFHSICKKLHARHHTYNRFLQHQQQHTLPPDLNIKFEGFNQYPLTIEASQRDLLKQKEVETFRTAMNTILSLRTDAYKQDIATLESQITLAMNNANIIKVVSQELPFVNSNIALRDHVCFQLSALYAATHQQYMEQKQSDSTLSQSTAMDESDSTNNNVKSDEHMANLIRNVLKEELKHMLKPSAPSPKKHINSHFKESPPKNEFERGRGNTPRRNGSGGHVRRSKSDSSRQSKSNSSTNSNRVNFSHHHIPSNSDGSPRGRRNYATTHQLQDRNRQRTNFKSKSPQSRNNNNNNNNYNYNNNNNYNNNSNNNYTYNNNRKRNSSPPPRHRRN